MSMDQSNKHIANLNLSAFNQLIRTKKSPSVSNSLNPALLSSWNLNSFQRGKTGCLSPQETKSNKNSISSSNKSLRDNIKFTFGELASSGSKNSQDIQKPIIPEEREPKLTAKREDKDPNHHIIFKGKPHIQEDDSSNYESDRLSTPKCTDSFVTSEFTIEKNEATMEYQEMIFEKEKYGDYDNLLRLYESEKKSRDNFENLYERAYNENNILRETIHNLRKSNESSINHGTQELQKENLSFKSIIESFKFKNKEKDSKLDVIETFQKENIELKESLENLKYSFKQQKILLAKLQNENHNYKEKIDHLTKSKNESLVLIHKYQIDIQELNEKFKKLKETSPASNSEQKPKPKNIFVGNAFLQDSVDAFKNKDIVDQCQIIDKAESLFSENENLKKMIQNLKAQLESNSHTQQVKILQNELEKAKFESESQKQQMKNEIEQLKRGNKEMFNNMRQKLREFDHYECHTLLKRTATKIPENTLAHMNKEEIISEFNFLKREYEELSKKMLSQADEMFEKKYEIKQLNIYKTTLYQELNTLQEQVLELNELKEHVAYLFHEIHSMKEKIKKFGVMYLESVKNQEKACGEDFVTSMSIISEIVKTNIQTIAEKKSQNINWRDEKGKKKLVQHLKNSLLCFVTTN